MRRAKPAKREILRISAKQHHIQTMIHHMLHRGKKSTATRVMYDTWILFASVAVKRPRGDL